MGNCANLNEAQCAADSTCRPSYIQDAAGENVYSRCLQNRDRSIYDVARTFKERDVLKVLREAMKAEDNAGGKPDGEACNHDTECGSYFCNPDTKKCDNDYHDAEKFNNNWMGHVMGHESHSRSTDLLDYYMSQNDKSCENEDAGMMYGTITCQKAYDTLEEAGLNPCDGQSPYFNEGGNCACMCNGRQVGLDERFGGDDGHYDYDYYYDDECMGLPPAACEQLDSKMFGRSATRGERYLGLLTPSSAAGKLVWNENKGLWEYVENQAYIDAMANRPENLWVDFNEEDGDYY